MQTTEISILGCGWLGMPLAEKLVRRGYSVKGSTTTSAKTITLIDSGVTPFLIELSATEIEGEIAEFLKSEILIIAIPPKKAAGPFSMQIETLLPHIQSSPVKKVLFISSTSVYGQSGDITEDVVPVPNSENGQELLKTEHILRAQNQFKTTVLRFGGLIGPDRHPVKYLAGRDNEHPNARVNLIHQIDCIGIILQIIELEKWGEVYNAVAPIHMTRKEYYTQKALEFGLPEPRFYPGTETGKSVNSKKVVIDLDFLFYKLNP